MKSCLAALSTHSAHLLPQEREREAPPHVERHAWAVRRAPRQASPEARVAQGEAMRGEPLRGASLREDHELNNHVERPVERERRRRRSVVVVCAAALSTAKPQVLRLVRSAGSRVLVPVVAHPLACSYPLSMSSSVSPKIHTSFSKVAGLIDPEPVIIQALSVKLVLTLQPCSVSRKMASAS